MALQFVENKNSAAERDFSEELAVYTGLVHVWNWRKQALIGVLLVKWRTSVENFYINVVHFKYYVNKTAFTCYNSRKRGQTGLFLM